MSEGLSVYAVILGMGLVTYLLRAGGYMIMGRFSITPAVRRGLEALPGAIVVSIVLPIVLKEGLPAILAIAVTAAGMIWLRRDLYAVIAGVAVAAAVRAAGF